MRKPRSWLTIVAPICLGVILLAGWFLTVAPGKISAYLLPSPTRVARSLWNSLVVYADGWSFIGVTLLEALTGCLVGFVVALPLAVLIYRSRLVSAAVLPFLGATQAIPVIALAPLLVLWTGYGLRAIVILCAIMVFFPILVSATVGLRHLDRAILSAAMVDGAGSAALLVHIELPLALPNILAGVRNGFTLSITGAVVGEMVMGGNGLGMLITAQHHAQNTAGMFATIIILALLASTVYSIVSVFERRWSRMMTDSAKSTSSEGRDVVVARPSLSKQVKGETCPTPRP
jgi:NitT/TauT family transport system permease protein